MAYKEFSNSDWPRANCQRTDFARSSMLILSSSGESLNSNDLMLDYNLTESRVNEVTSEDSAISDNSISIKTCTSKESSGGDDDSGLVSGNKSISNRKSTSGKSSFVGVGVGSLGRSKDKNKSRMVFNNNNTLPRTQIFHNSPGGGVGIKPNVNNNKIPTLNMRSYKSSNNNTSTPINQQSQILASSAKKSENKSNTTKPFNNRNIYNNNNNNSSTTLMTSTTPTKKTSLTKPAVKLNSSSNENISNNNKESLNISNNKNKSPTKIIHGSPKSTIDETACEELSSDIIEEFLQELSQLRSQMEGLKTFLETSEKRNEEKDALILKQQRQIDMLIIKERLNSSSNNNNLTPVFDQFEKDQITSTDNEKKLVNNNDGEINPPPPPPAQKLTNSAVQTDNNQNFPKRGVTYPEENDKVGQLVSFRIGRRSSSSFSSMDEQLLKS